MIINGAAPAPQRARSPQALGVFASDRDRLGQRGDYEAYGYDLAGNRTSLRKRDGVTLTFAFDGTNRITQKNVPQSASGAAGYSVHYAHDVAGAQLYARFGSGSGPGVTHYYDSLGRPSATLTTMGGAGRWIFYQYDAGGRRSRITHPDGNYIAYAYDAASRPTTIVENDNVLLVTFAHDAPGRRTATAFNGGSMNYGYDPVSRLASLFHNLDGTSGDQNLGFGYNPASQIVQRTSSNDAYASNTAYAVSRSYAANGLNQYTSAGPATFAYDANGNLGSDGSTSFVYDAENRLVSASGARSATLVYDPLGRLFQTSGGSEGVTQFLHDGDALIGEFNTAGSMIRRYVHGTAEGVDDPLIWYDHITAGTRRGLVTDHQGSVISVLNLVGTPIAINAYDSWGIPNATNLGRFGYTGQAWIPELGMWHYKARVYSPTLGRFLQTDPVGYDDQVNLYAYVANDPVNRTDPTGTRIFVEDTRHRQTVLAAINALTRARYNFDRNGNLVRVSNRGGGGQSQYYDRRLGQAISSRNTITIVVSNTYRLGGPQGSDRPLEGPAGGAVTVGAKDGGDQTIYWTGRAWRGWETRTDGTNGRLSNNSAETNLAHEIVGPAVSHMVDRALSNGIDNENRVRAENGLPLRLPDPGHVE